MTVTVVGQRDPQFHLPCPSGVVAWGGRSGADRGCDALRSFER